MSEKTALASVAICKMLFQLILILCVGYVVFGLGYSGWWFLGLLLVLA